MTYVRWRIVALLVVASFVAYLLRTNMSVAGERMMAEHGFTKVQLGLVLAAFAWGYALFQFPGGVYGDRLGGRRALTAMAVLWGILNLLVGLLPAAAPAVVLLGALILLRFLMGAAQAPLYPVTGGGVVYHWFPAGSWAFPNALMNVGLTFGAAAAGPLIAWLAQTVGWRQSFVLTSPLAFLVAAVWWWYGRDRPAEHWAVGPVELKLIDAGRAAGAPATPTDWQRVIRNRNLLLITASYFCSNYVFYFFFNWLYVYLVDVRGFALLEGGWLSAVPWMVGAGGAAAGGILADRLSRRHGPRLGYRIPGAVGLAFTAVLLAAAAGAANAYVAVMLLALCFAFQQMTEGPFWAAAVAVSGRHASTGCGLMNTGGNVVGGIGAVLVPFTADHLGWMAALGTASGFAVVGAALWLGIRADEAIDRDQGSAER
ncbi:MAG TPA: MFS transporter [Gemmatimonadales bacterium]|nr:MFS transporter [Gemmatimonadales bacterium]